MNWIQICTLHTERTPAQEQAAACTSRYHHGTLLCHPQSKASHKHAETNQATAEACMLKLYARQGVAPAAASTLASEWLQHSGLRTAYRTTHPPPNQLSCTCISRRLSCQHAMRTTHPPPTPNPIPAPRPLPRFHTPKCGHSLAHLQQYLAVLPARHVHCEFQQRHAQRTRLCTVSAWYPILPPVPPL